MSQQPRRGSTFQEVRNKALDLSKVVAVNVVSNREYQDIDIAVVKATNHDDVPPKEKHVLTLVNSVQRGKSRAEVQYCVATIFKRLKETTTWLTAQKTLMVIHRLLREGGDNVVEEIYVQNEEEKNLNLSNFMDSSSNDTSDLSGWVRTYAAFLNEKVSTIHVVGFDVENERCTGDPPHSATRSWTTENLLVKLPKLQQLLRRLLGCAPEDRRAVRTNKVVGHAFNFVIRESFKLYRATFDGIINLIDKFFDMQRIEAYKGLEIYKSSMRLAQELGDLYRNLKKLDSCSNQQFPQLELPDSGLLNSMEEYTKNLVAGRPVEPSTSTPAAPASTTKLEVPLPVAGSKPSPPSQLTVHENPKPAVSSPFDEAFDPGLSLDGPTTFQRSNSILGNPTSLGSDPFEVSLPPVAAAAPSTATGAIAGEFDLLGGFEDLQVAPQPAVQANPFGDVFDNLSTTTAPAAAASESGHSPVLSKNLDLDSLYNQHPVGIQQMSSPFAAFTPPTPNLMPPANRVSPGNPPYAQNTNPFGPQPVSYGISPSPVPQMQPVVRNDPFTPIPPQQQQRGLDSFAGFQQNSPGFPQAQLSQQRQAPDPFADFGTPQPQIQSKPPMNLQQPQTSQDPFATSTIGMQPPPSRQSINPFDDFPTNSAPTPPPPKQSNPFADDLLA